MASEFTELGAFSLFDDDDFHAAAVGEAAVAATAAAAAAGAKMPRATSVAGSGRGLAGGFAWRKPSASTGVSSGSPGSAGSAPATTPPRTLPTAPPPLAPPPSERSTAADDMETPRPPSPPVPVTAAAPQAEDPVDSLKRTMPVVEEVDLSADAVVGVEALEVELTETSAASSAPPSVSHTLISEAV